MEIEDHREAWARRWAAEAAVAQAEVARRRACLPTLVAILVEDFGATAVALIGSLARGEQHGHSDIDLVVSGLAAASLWKAGAKLDRAAGVHVDLIPWEDATSELRQVVMREGEILHGRF